MSSEEPSGLLARPAVRRVQAALEEAGSGARVIALEETARTAADAAAALNCPLGAIVKSLVFTVGDQPVMALVAGDRRCDSGKLPQLAGLDGKVFRADADAARAATGYTIGGVPPLAHPSPLPTVIDASFGRFDTIFAAAGHPHCVFGTTLDELARLSGGAINHEVSEEM